MSVPAWQRDESPVEFLSNFHKMRKGIIVWLMRDFGIKKKEYTIDLIAQIYQISPTDAETLQKLGEHYGISEYEVQIYPDWLINTWRKEVLDILHQIGIEIELANTIYITSQAEYNERRNHWNLAIGYCNALKDKFQEIISCINVKLGAFMDIAELLEKEIILLKGVRKADNKALNKISG